MMDPAGQKAEVHRIFNQVAGVYDLLNHVLSLGEDLRWRRFVARSLRPGPLGRVLDVATGTGDLALALLGADHKPQVVGLDLVPAMLAKAQSKVRARNLRLPLLAGDATCLPFPDQTFDAVTIAFGIRNIPDRVGAMAEMARVLTPQGRLYVLEFTSPQSPLVRGLYQRYLARLLPKVGGWISGDEASYRYLAETIIEFPSPQGFRKQMRQAGLIAPRSLSLTSGIAWLHVGEKRG